PTARYAPSLHDALPIYRPAAAIAAGLGMVHQHPANVPAMTVAENIELGERGVYRDADVRKRAATAARQVGFDVDVDARVRDLSVDRKSTRLNSSHVKIS